MFAFFDIVIGLLFTYLILSLIASEIQEQLAAILEYRAVHLKRAIKILLDENSLGKKVTASRWVTRDANQTPVIIPLQLESDFKDQDPKQVWLGTDNRVLAISDTDVEMSLDKNKGTLINGGTEVRKAEIEQQSISPVSLAELLYENSEIRDLNQYAIGIFVRNILRFRIRTSAEQAKEKFSEGPSYIPPESFAISVLEVIQDQLPAAYKLNVQTETVNSFIEKINTLPFSQGTKQRIIEAAQRLDLKATRASLTGSQETTDGQPLQEIRKEIQSWYAKSIAPSSGVYKRNAKGLSLLIGILMAVVLNINTFNIVDALQNQQVRSAILNRAEQITQDQDLIEKCIKNQTDLTPTQAQDVCTSRAQTMSKQMVASAPSLQIGWQSGDIPKEIQQEVERTKGFSLVGWIISAIAISMGAPFWFDIFSRVMNVRNANKP